MSCINCVNTENIVCRYRLVFRSLCAVTVYGPCLLLQESSLPFGKSCVLRGGAYLTESVFLSYGFCGLHRVTPVHRPSSSVQKDEASNSSNTMLKNVSSVLFLKESQSSLDIKNKLGTTKQTENGQLEPQSKAPAEDLALTFR